MKKIFSLLILLILLAVSIFSIENVQVNFGENDAVSINVLEAHEDFTIVEIKLNNYLKGSSEIDNIDYTFFYLPSQATRLEKGNPELPVVARSLMIPPQAKMHTEIIESTYTTISGVVLPSKGSLLRIIDPATVPFEFSDVYRTDAFFPENLVEINDPFIMREVRGITFHASPFTVNPVTEEIRVYDRIVFKVYASGVDTIDVLPTRASRVTKDFVYMYQNLFINYDRVQSRNPNYIEEIGSMLVIAFPAFMEAAQPYVDWKNQKGIKTVMVPSTTAGATAAQIKTFITNYWNENPELAFVQIVGDAPQVPTSIWTGGQGGSRASDTSLVNILGNNQFPDIYIGRFSAETVEHVLTQVERTIWYERDLAEGEWINKAMGLAGNESGGHNGESDRAHMEIIRQLFLNNQKYSHVDGIYQPQATHQQVTNAVNDGRALINYIAHGSKTGWHFLTQGGTPMDYHDTYVNQLTNDGMLPHIFSVACVNGDFLSGGPSFSETWLLATNDTTGAPTGAMAFYGASINQDWVPPMHAQDKFAELHAEDIFKTIGGLYFSASTHMVTQFPSGSSNNTLRTWNIFGDASLMVRHKVPIAMEIEAPDVFFLGLTEYQVIVDTPGALVSLYNPETKELIAFVYANEIGEANFVLEEPFQEPMTLLLTITAYNRITDVREISVIPNEGAYIMFDSYDFVQGSSATYGTTATFNVTIFNIGQEEADNVSITLSTEDQYITLVNNTATIPYIEGEGYFTINEAFTIEIAENIPDQHAVQFNIIATRTEDIWNMKFRMPIDAPSLIWETPIVIEIEGNDNGRLDPGEIVEIHIPFFNEGHALSSAGKVVINSNNPDVVLSENIRFSSSVEAHDRSYAIFNVEVNPETMPGSRVVFGFFAEFSTQLIQANFTLPVGLAVEDFESGDFESYEWVNTSVQPWSITDSVIQQGNYSAASGNIINNQTSVLSITRELTAPGVISFYYKTSSLPNQDILQFYLNTATLGQWSGEVDWTFVEFNIPAGVHQFRWVYRKGTLGSAGQDKVWIDYITFPLGAGSDFNGPVINVSEDDFDFSESEPQNEYTKQFYLLNLGNTNLVFDVTSVPTGFTLEAETGLPLENYIMFPNTNLLMTLKFNPSEHIDYSGDVVFTTNINDGSDFYLNLSANLEQVPDSDLPNIMTTSLLGNYPNPFNPETTIRFSVAKPQNVQISVYNIRGQLVKNLLNEKFETGHHDVIWQGEDNNGRSVSSGVYFYRFVTEESTKVNRMLLMK